MHTTAKYVSRLQTVPSCSGNIGDWKGRHLRAVQYPNAIEQGILAMLKGWLEYADRHRERFDSEIGEDGVLGDYWEAIGDSLRGLLNGECGRLDCDTLDGIILNAMRDASIDVDSK